MGITDYHVHVGKDAKTGFSLGCKELLDRMDANGISRSVIFACPNVPPRATNPYEESNNLVLRYASLSNRLLPLMFVHSDRDSLNYIESEHSNFLGFKLYSHVPGMITDYRQLSESEIMKFLIRTKKPLLFHIGLNDGERVRDLRPIISASDSPIILAHCGRLFSRDIEEVSAFKNTYIDVSPLSTTIDNGERFLPDQLEMDENVRNLKPSNILKYLSEKFNGRILWGSDSPWCNHLGKRGYAGEVEITREALRGGVRFAELF